MSNATNNFAFIDSQNLHLGIKSLGWKLDYRKFRLFLKNKYGVSKAFLFVGYLPNNQTLYANLQQAGYILIFKPVVFFNNSFGQPTAKGNVDAELVLHAAAIQYQKYDKAIIVTNDGDFTCLLEYLETQNKLEKILAPNKRYSRLFKPYIGKLLTLDNLQKKLEI